MSRATFVREHVTRPGEPIGVDRYTGGAPWGERCQGDTRSLYTRGGADGKRWVHAGWICLKCGTVELVALEAGRPGWYRPGQPGVERLGILPPRHAGVASTPDAGDERRHSGDRASVVTDVDELAVARLEP